MTSFRKLVLKRDERAKVLGYVPRQVKVPVDPGSLDRIGEALEARSHAAMLRRIRSGD